METGKIYNENCLDTMARMPDAFVDLTVTSPPYDDLRDYNGYVFDFEPIADELFRVTKEGGVVVWVVGDATINGSETGTSFKQALYFLDIGFNLHDTMIYKKKNPMPVRLDGIRYSNGIEFMFVFSIGKPKTANLITTTTTTTKQRGNRYNKDGTKRDIDGKVNDRSVISNVWEYSVGSFGNNDDKTNHPASFPENLAKEHIYSWSNEDDLVYDPCMGSGTTAKMAHLLKRDWIGSEISREYIEIAKRRLEPYLMQTTLAI